MTVRVLWSCSNGMGDWMIPWVVAMFGRPGEGVDGRVDGTAGNTEMMEMGDVLRHSKLLFKYHRSSEYPNPAGKPIITHA